MAKYAWYTRVTDAVHRLTVLSLVGGTLYMTGGLMYSMYINGKKYEQQLSQKSVESEKKEGDL
ncbi:LAMI_0E15984g1_1 [Lachancea mirantina]|uniref:LAMI_0E15984g1_1 n=1 Tax=Lachancea mirantina TaxID=1230905 RepID=A0A1G4JSP3_9SACH|nr:LAMI_0E15984g1_1 [Lachancea mirantina]